MLDMTHHAHDILVFGATGKTGRRVVERLQARGVPTRAGSRSAQPPFDWQDRDTWAPALDGAAAVYVTYFPDLAVPGAPEAVGELARLAADAGVQRIVLLSGRGEEEAQRSEEAVQAAGMDWTILRSSWFDQTSARASCSRPSWKASSRCRSAACASRSCTPTTSPTSRSSR